MEAKQRLKQRPLAFEDGQFYWNIQHVPHRLPDGKTPYPGRSSAVFVVHGIGEQRWTETAALLRAGFEEAFEDIYEWQQKNLTETERANQVPLPPPLVFEGYWANYDDIEATFPDDWKKFVEREQSFFGNIWRQRVVSGARAFKWMVGQQLKLLSLRTLFKVGPMVWILYWPLQFVSISVLIYAWFRYRTAITGFINDIRLYVNPRGVVERAIVQRIDERVADQFLRLIGLDRDFRQLKFDELIEVGGERLSFNRIVWVAHSLGTVISYNVLSALFHKAAELERNGDDEQREGVALFRLALCRFITMGSPLDKVAFLFEDSLHPWPKEHRALLGSGEALKDKNSTDTEWWINFYHVLDPVSGSIESPYICGHQAPSNKHIDSGWIPGFAHIAYWQDPLALRFIVSRVFGSRYLRDREVHPKPLWILNALSVTGYVIWAAALFYALYALYRWGPDILREIGSALLKWVTG